MTNAEIIAQLRAKIEGLIERYGSVKAKGILQEGYKGGRLIGYEDALNILKRTQEKLEKPVLSDLEKSEKPKNFDFNYEFSHFLDKKDEELGSTTWSEEDLQELARHFYDLGCRRTAEKYDEIEYNQQREEKSEKPINLKGLEKEIEEYFHESTFNTGFNYDDLQEIARHFAKWGGRTLKEIRL